MNRIKRARTLNGLTQVQLAKVLNVGRTTVTMWETSKQNPDNETLRKLAKALGVPTDYLVGAGVFENWDIIMGNFSLVFAQLRQQIPPDYIEGDDDRFLIAALDIAFFYNHDELFLIQWFSSAIKSVHFFDNNLISIDFTDTFRASIASSQSSCLKTSRKEPTPKDELSPLDVQLMAGLRSLSVDQKRMLLAQIDTLLKLQG